MASDGVIKLGAGEPGFEMLVIVSRRIDSVFGPRGRGEVNAYSHLGHGGLINTLGQAKLMTDNWDGRTRAAEEDRWRPT